MEIGARQCSAVFVKNSDDSSTPLKEMLSTSGDSVLERKNVSTMWFCPLKLTAFQWGHGI